MVHRGRRSSHFWSETKLLPFAALRETFREGYSLAAFRADIGSGVIVASVAIPLAMALAIAAGAPPQHGLYTAIIAGFLTALLGGSRFQVSGPTASVVILLPITNQYGLTGLLVAGFLAGWILIGMALLRMGRIIQFIPHTVVTGITAGIAVVIASLQFRDALGLAMPANPHQFFERLRMIIHALPTAAPTEILLTLLTILLLWLWPKCTKRVPAPIVVLPLISLLAYALSKNWEAFSFATIGSRFPLANAGANASGIAALPHLHLPWNYAPEFHENFKISLAAIQDLLPSAFAIAMLGAIETLLSAVVADGLAKTNHSPDAELLALGASNVICPFFGGITATGALARTATNIRFGARSPFSAMFHAVFILLALVVAAPLLAHLPMAALAALLLMTAYNISDWRHFKHLLHVAPRGEAIVLLLCFLLTMAFDMVIGVTAGILLAAFLFMQQMVALTSSKLLLPNETMPSGPKIPHDVLVYEIAGPLFFGAAKRAMESLSRVAVAPKVVILPMNAILTIDLTGLMSFESAIRRLEEAGAKIILTGIRSETLAVLERYHFFENHRVSIFATLEEALNSFAKKN